MKYDDVELIYSTPSTYIKTVMNQNVVWPTKYDDMFPYANTIYGYWTGFYTSRPNSKDYIKRASTLL